MKNLILTLAMFMLLMSTQCLLKAYPTSLNVVPTANILPAGDIQLLFESDGHSNPFEKDSTQYLYSQIGILDHLEVGVDLYDFGGENVMTYNAKVQLMPESDRLPAMAIGAMDISKETTPGSYLVGSKNIGPWGLHAGIAHQADQTWAMLGTNFTVNQKISLAADYQTGDGQEGTVGVNYSLTPAMGLSVYYSKNNTESSADYVGAYIGYCFSTK